MQVCQGVFLCEWSIELMHTSVLEPHRTVLVTGPGCQGVKPHIYIISHKETLQILLLFFEAAGRIWPSLTDRIQCMNHRNPPPPMQCQHKWKIDNSSEVRERSWIRLGSTTCLKSHTLIFFFFRSPNMLWVVLGNRTNNCCPRFLWKDNLGKDFPLLIVISSHWKVVVYLNLHLPLQLFFMMTPFQCPLPNKLYGLWPLLKEPKSLRRRGSRLNNSRGATENVFGSCEA